MTTGSCLYYMHAYTHAQSFCIDINTNKFDKPGEIPQNYPEKDTLMHEQN